MMTFRGAGRTYLIKQLFKGSLIQYLKIDAAFSVPARYAWQYANGRWRYTAISSDKVYIFQVNSTNINTL